MAFDIGRIDSGLSTFNRDCFLWEGHMNILTIGWEARNVKPRRSEMFAGRSRMGLIAMLAGVLLIVAAPADLPAYADPTSVVDVDVIDVPLRGRDPAPPITP